MNDLEKFNQLPYSSRLAITTWLIGTIIFIINFIFPNTEEILITGIFYIVVAVIANGLTLVYLLYKIITDNHNSRYFLIQAGILLLNIPVAVLYAYLVISQFTSLNNF